GGARAADPHPGRVGRGEPGLRIGRGGGDRLLGLHVLSGGDDRLGHLRMRGRDREVHDDLHLRVGEDVLGGAGSGDAELRGARGGGLGEQIPDDVYLHVGEGGETGEVLGGDGAG